MGDDHERNPTVEEVTSEVFRRLSEHFQQLANGGMAPLRKTEPEPVSTTDERRAAYRRELIGKLRRK